MCLVYERLKEMQQGQPAGTQAVAQTQGQIDNPHTSVSGENHVDGWSATVEADGSTSTAKEHSG